MIKIQANKWRHTFQLYEHCRPKLYSDLHLGPVTKHSCHSVSIVISITTYVHLHCATSKKIIHGNENVKMSWYVSIMSTQWPAKLSLERDWITIKPPVTRVLYIYNATKTFMEVKHIFLGYIQIPTLQTTNKYGKQNNLNRRFDSQCNHYAPLILISAQK